MAIQLHKFLLGMIMVGMIVAGFTIFMASGVDQYSISGNSSEYSQFNTSFNKLSELSTQMNEFKGAEQDTTVTSNNFFDDLTQPFDVVGNFFTRMYQSAKVFMASTDLVSSMIDNTISVLPIGGYGSVLKTGLSLMVLVVVFVGIFLAFVTKSERT